MKQLGISPFGIIQTPARRRSRVPVPYSRNEYNYSEFFFLDETTYYAGGWLVTYVSGLQYVFYSASTTDADYVNSLVDAFYGLTPIRGFTGGEFINFVFKPLIVGWYEYHP